jgi:uncharacterized protein
MRHYSINVYRKELYIAVNEELGKWLVLQMKEKSNEAKSSPKNFKSFLSTTKDFLDQQSMDIINQNPANNKAGILLFLKYPEPEKVKSRLSKELGVTTALHFYHCFVADVLTTIRALNLPIVICYSPANSKQKFKKWLGKYYLFINAQGESFGQKLQYCFQNAFRKGFHQVILVASDNPDIPKEYLTEAICSLQLNDVVIGPCDDGGYYLLGFTKKGFTPIVFDDIPWSTPHVFQKTFDILQEKKRVTHILPTWYDIDTFEDLLKFYNRNKDSPLDSLTTMTALDTYLKKNNNL